MHTNSAPHTPETLAKAALSITQGDRAAATRFAVTSLPEEFEELSPTDMVILLGSVLVINKEN